MQFDFFVFLVLFSKNNCDGYFPCLTAGLHVIIDSISGHLYLSQCHLALHNRDSASMAARNG